MSDIPKSEHKWERILDEDGNVRFIVTSDSRRETYYLYKPVGDGYERVGKAKNPRYLLRRYGV